MRDLDFAVAALADEAGGKSRVIAADGDERGDAEFLEHGEKIFHVLLGFGRIGARGAEDGAALEVDVPHVADGQRLDVRGVALREIFKTVAEADDFEALIDAFNGGRGDDAVDARARGRHQPKFPICLCSCEYLNVS